MGRSKVMTATQFEKLVWSQTVIRGSLVHLPPSTLHPKGQTQVGIWLYLACMDDNCNQFFNGTYYQEYVPDSTYQRSVGIEVTSFGSTRESREEQLEHLFQTWKMTTPEWLVAKPVYVCTKGTSRTGEMSLYDSRFLQHLARFQTRVAYEIKNPKQHGWYLCSVYYRLGRFIEQQNVTWDKLTRQLAPMNAR